MVEIDGVDVYSEIPLEGPDTVGGSSGVVEKAVSDDDVLGKS